MMISKSKTGFFSISIGQLGSIYPKSCFKSGIHVPDLVSIRCLNIWRYLSVRKAFPIAMLVKNRSFAQMFDDQPAMPECMSPTRRNDNLKVDVCF